MRYAADIVQTKELTDRASALVAYAVAQDPAFSMGALTGFEARGWSKYAHHVKAAVAALDSSDATMALGPLVTAFIGAVDRESILGALDGAVRVPLAAPGGARIQIGHVETSPASEGELKSVARVDYLAAPDDFPQKIIAQIVASAEALRRLDPTTQAALSRHLVSATAAATDVALVTALTTGSPASSADVATLLSSISGGAPRRPYLIGGLDSLLSLAPGTLRDVRDLGVTVLQTPAAAGRLIAVDASGLLIADDGEATIETARHANMILDDGSGSPSTTVVSLWSRNLVCLRSERSTQFALRSGAVAFASTGSPV
jgi:hypothetical protein